MDAVNFDEERGALIVRDGESVSRREWSGRVIVTGCILCYVAVCITLFVCTIVMAALQSMNHHKYQYLAGASLGTCLGFIFCSTFPCALMQTQKTREDGPCYRTDW